MSDMLTKVLNAQRAFVAALTVELGHAVTVSVAAPASVLRQLHDALPMTWPHAAPSMLPPSTMLLEGVAYTEAPADYCGAQDQHCVNHFAHAMSAKMAVSAAKGRSGWDDRKRVSDNDLRLMLREHVEKGDPIDVANFCMMLYMRGASTRSDK